MTYLKDSITEAEFQRTVIEYAHLRGWLVHHTRPSISGGRWTTAIMGDPGFPDLCFARDGSVVFAELKSMKGRLTKDQKAWLDELGAGCLHYGVFVWQPSDWPHIEEVLK